MLTSIKNYGLAIIIVLVVGLCVFFKIELDHYRKENTKLTIDNKTLQVDVDKQNAAVKKLNQQYQSQLNKVKIAEKESLKQKAAYDKAAKAILNARIDTTCKGAVKWGAMQGTILSNQWATN